MTETKPISTQPASPGAGGAPADNMPSAGRPPVFPMTVQIDRVREAIARVSHNRRTGLRTMPCPNCETGLLYFAVRRCGSISAACSCPGGVLIDDMTLDEAVDRAKAQAAARDAQDWLSKSQPPEL